LGNQKYEVFPQTSTFHEDPFTYYAKQKNHRIFLDSGIQGLVTFLNFSLGDVPKLRNALGGGGQRFVTDHCKDIGICTVFCYKREEGLKSRKIALRNMWTSPYYLG
jgi:hypothetical protein